MSLMDRIEIFAAVADLAIVAWIAWLVVRRWL